MHSHDKPVAIASLAVAILAVALLLATLRDLMLTRDSLDVSRESARICHDALIRSDARLGQIEALLGVARKSSWIGGQ